MEIDIGYDFRKDAGGKDPDKYSATLQDYHYFLWSKGLANSSIFKLEKNINGAYLYHNSHLGEFTLSSDSIIPTFSKWKRLANIIECIPIDDYDKFLHLAYTIGGMMIFPSNIVNGKSSINRERGFNSKIVDRMDLTLECIRRYYLNQVSPMLHTLERYKDYFQIFGSFKGYVDFFLLNDLVSHDYGEVIFFMKFNNFEGISIPGNLEQYITYRENTINFIKKRNDRIKKYSIERKYNMN